MNIFKHCRETIRSCTNKENRDELRARTDEAKGAYDLFVVSADPADMERLVAQWTRMLVALDRCEPLPSGDPAGAGRLHLPATGSFDHDPDILAVIEKLRVAA